MISLSRALKNVVRWFQSPQGSEPNVVLFLKTSFHYSEYSELERNILGCNTVYSCRRDTKIWGKLMPSTSRSTDFELKINALRSYEILIDIQLQGHTVTQSMRQEPIKDISMKENKLLLLAFLSFILFNQPRATLLLVTCQNGIIPQLTQLQLRNSTRSRDEYDGV
jgi:hypothetical protein